MISSADIQLPGICAARAAHVGGCELNFFIDTVVYVDQFQWIRYSTNYIYSLVDVQESVDISTKFSSK